MMDEVVVVDYDPDWPARFEEERARIVSVLGDAMRGVLAIEHVGSTAVPDLAAKPIIDIMIGIQSLADGEPCVAPLATIGYEYLGEYGIPERLYFRRGSRSTQHLHMVRHGSRFWSRHLLFRDLLRRRPDIAEQYGALKRELAIKYRTQRLEYTEAKTPFIEDVLVREPAEAATPTASRRPDAQA